MQKSSIKLTKNAKQFIFSLIENGEKNDSDIAKEIKISKSSASRIRKSLSQDELLIDCIPILNLEKLGVNFYAVLIFQWNSFSDKKLTQKMEAEFVSAPQVVYFAEGSNPNTNYISMMAFTEFDDYNDFLKEFREKYGNDIGRLETLFIQPKRILKQDYGGLAKMLIGGANK